MAENEPQHADTVAECAQHLALISKDLRAAGDVNLVRLSGDGVTPDHLTLADELWLIAVRLGYPINGKAPAEAEALTEPDLGGAAASDHIDGADHA